MLQSQDDPFPKTHDIEDLAAQAARLNKRLQSIRQVGGGFDALCFRVSLSWRIGEPMPEIDEFNEALQLAQAIYDLPKLGHEINAPQQL